ncbi:iron-sulfur cluster assembly scaffold protein [bacterium]|nr:MAG: iron-sulfur cluster assembly scaffold protein [bacterium]
MNYTKFQELVTAREGFRSMDDASATGEYFSDSCGDLYTFYLKVRHDEVIEDISYFTTGCGFGTATCSLLVEMARGKTLNEAALIDEGTLDRALGGYPEKKKDYPARSIAALRNAIENFRTRSGGTQVSDVPADWTATEELQNGPRVFRAGGKVTVKLSSLS